ncbi:hypothetical protein [Methanogenium cariaci]|uniref:hypothetical protein n=1 Tax=Methanogenium cariaci TaxID=2197 RepID=UPI000783D39D|nr:hypothetical protein [Methanogenium cariaci]
MSSEKEYRSPDVTPRAKRTVHAISQDQKRKRELYRHHPYDHLHPPTRLIIPGNTPISRRTTIPIPFTMKKIWGGPTPISRDPSGLPKRSPEPGAKNGKEKRGN